MAAESPICTTANTDTRYFQSDACASPRISVEALRRIFAAAGGILVVEEDRDALAILEGILEPSDGFMSIDDLSAELGLGAGNIGK